MQTVTQAYVMGITDARALWRQFERDGIANLETARDALKNCEDCLAMGFAGDVREMLKGERDFFRQRVKLMAETRAREGVTA
jgi:type VI protein secretion system component VasF